VTVQRAPRAVGVVEVWLIHTGLPESRVRDLFAFLDDGERERAVTMAAPTNRRRYIVAHAAARLIVGARLGAPAQGLSWQRGPHGKPKLSGRWTGVHISLSHAADYAALALSTERRVGVDIQDIPVGVDITRMALRFFPPAEASYVLAPGTNGARLTRFTRLWARKEACSKVGGGRLIPGLALTVTGRGQLTVTDPAGLISPCRVQDVTVPRGLHAAVAAEHTLPFTIIRHRWPAGRQRGPVTQRNEISVP
jgi:4'-phosphopantetheinyl transferase